jgi:hypothetical protein
MVHNIYMIYTTADIRILKNKTKDVRSFDDFKPQEG